MNRHQFLRSARLCGLFSIFLTGCGGSPEGPVLYTATGIVHLDGEPIESGEIQFRADSGAGKAFSGVITNGEYSLETEAGSMSVQITASRPIPGKFDEGASPDDEPQPLMEMYIPDQYNSKTTLTAEISADGDNMTMFDLSAK